MIEPSADEIRVHLGYLVATHPEWPPDIVVECYAALDANDFERLDGALTRLDRYTRFPGLS